MQCPRIFGLPNIYTESIELIECHGLMHHTRIHDKRTHTHTRPNNQMWNEPKGLNSRNNNNDSRKSAHNNAKAGKDKLSNLCQKP